MVVEDASEFNKKSELEIIEFSTVGVSKNINEVLAKRQIRKKLLQSQEFLYKLLRLSESNSTMNSLRRLSLEFLWTGLANLATEKIAEVAKGLDIEQFMVNNIINSNTATAKLAGKVLLKIIPEISKEVSSVKVMSQVKQFMVT